MHISPPQNPNVSLNSLRHFKKCWRVCVLGFLSYMYKISFFSGWAFLLLVELFPLAFVILSGLHKLFGASLALALLVAGSLHSNHLIVDAFFHQFPLLAGFVEDTEALVLDTVKGACGSLGERSGSGCRGGVGLGRCGAGRELYVWGLV
jgi:hypothetical protein